MRARSRLSGEGVVTNSSVARGGHVQVGFTRLGRALLASSALTLGLLAPQLARAQAAPQAAAPGAAQSMSFSIPAQPLANAIDAFIRVTGWQVGYSSALADGLFSKPVNGAHAPLEALRIMLAGTGIGVSATGPRTATLVAPPSRSGAASDVLLDMIQVQGEDPTRHVDGYLATVSATATGIATPIIETPQSVSVVTSDLIRDTGASTVTEAVQYTPSVNAQSPAFSRTVDDLMIRGFNVANGNMGMLRDGMKYQSNVYDGGQEPYGLERIEILRGPSSILYGQLSPGGVVNAVSKRPTFEPFYEANAEYGSFNWAQISTDMGGQALGNPNMAYRFTTLFRQADTNIDYVNDDRIYIAPAFTWRNDSTSLTILANYQQIDSRFVAPMPYSALASGQVSRSLFIGNTNYDTFETETSSIGYLFEHEFDNGLRLRNATRYYQADVTWNYMQWGLLQANGNLIRRASDRQDTSSGVTSDTSLEWKFETGAIVHTALAGFDYYYRGYDSDRYRSGLYNNFNIYFPDNSQLPPTINYKVNYGSNSTGNQYGLYLQDQMKIWDKLVLLVGGRYDWAQSESTSYQTNTVTNQNDSAFSGRAGLVYLFDNGLAPYLSVSQSFQPQVGADSFTGVAFQPSKGLQYEAGVRYEPVGANYLLSAAIYDITQSNVVTTDANGLQYQIGEVESKGFEFSATGKFGALNVVAAYSYTDARITQSVDPAEIGQREALVPLNTVALWADYALDELGVRGLKIGAGVRYLSDMNMPDVGTAVPGYTLVDAMVRYDLGAANPGLKGAVLALNGKNIFNTQYMTCTGSDGCRYGVPASVTATLTYRW